MSILNILILSYWYILSHMYASFLFYAINLGVMSHSLVCLLIHLITKLLFCWLISWQILSMSPNSVQLLTLPFNLFSTMIQSVSTCNLYCQVNYMSCLIGSFSSSNSILQSFLRSLACFKCRRKLVIPNISDFNAIKSSKTQFLYESLCCCCMGWLVLTL